MRLNIAPPLVGAALVLLIFASLSGWRVHSQPNPQTRVFEPFVLHERELNKSADGAVTKEVDFTVARRSDGSLMRSFVISGAESPNGEDGKVVFLWDVTKGMKVTLEPFTRSIMTQHLSNAEIQEYLNSQHACGAVQAQQPNENRASNARLGHSVIQVEESDSVQRAMRWVAPDLDCYPLEKTIWLLEPRRGGDYQETVVTDIEVGALPSSLFELPTDYTERSPLQIEAEYTARFSGHPFFGQQVAQEAEKQYRLHQLSQGAVQP